MIEVHDTTLQESPVRWLGNYIVKNNAHDASFSADSCPSIEISENTYDPIIRLVYCNFFLLR